MEIDKEATYVLRKSFEGWSPGTRIGEVLEVLPPEGDTSRERALVRIGAIQVAIPLSYITKLRPRSGTAGQ